MNQATKAVLIQKLKELNLNDGFPYEDIKKIQESHEDKLADSHSQHDLTEDFNAYQMTIAGSVSYILAGKRIPVSQKKSLETFEAAREMIIRRTT